MSSQTEKLTKLSDGAISAAQPAKSFEFMIVAHVNQTASAAAWQEQIRAKHAAAARASFDRALASHSAVPTPLNKFFHIILRNSPTVGADVEEIFCVE